MIDIKYYRLIIGQAIQKKEVKKLQSLLNQLQKKYGWIDCFLTEEDDHCQTPLLQALLLKEWGFSKEKQEMIDLLLEKGSDINRLNSEGRTPLWHAIFKKQTKAALYLLEKGADVNKPSYGKKIGCGGMGFTDTALMCAVRGENVTLMKALIQKGANLYKKNHEEKTVFDLALEKVQKKMVRLLQNEMKKNDIQKGDLLKAVQTRKEDLVRVLLAFDKQKVFDEKEKEQAFLLGAKYGLIKAVQVLIQEGVNVNTKDEKNENALMKALLSGKEKMLNLLIKEGINLNDKDLNEETALMKAAVLPLQETFIQAIIQSGADVNLSDKKGRTALMRAAEFGTTRDNIVYELLKLGADVHAVDEAGMTALMYGVASEKKVVCHLLEFGSDVLKKNKEGKDAYNLAMEQGRSQNAGLILQALKQQLKLKKISTHQVVKSQQKQEQNMR
ncbi:MAG: ankyrin repeat domain-containing protein [Alphaproteobacteria bacterium]|nr:ankyrin repeat domain-containing protein [Alphaproteobacteria bacterium]